VATKDLYGLYYLMKTLKRWDNMEKVKTIAKLAQKMPDTPIDEIIRGDMI